MEMRKTPAATLKGLDEATRQRLKQEFEESARQSSLGLPHGSRLQGEKVQKRETS